MPDIEITLKGENAAAFATRMASEFAAIFGEELVARAPEGEAKDTKSMEAVAAVGLVMALPRAILGTIELADRLHAAEKWQRFVAWVKRERGDTVVEVTPPEGTPEAIEDLHPAKILDPLAEEARRTKAAEQKAED